MITQKDINDIYNLTSALDIASELGLEIKFTVKYALDRDRKATWFISDSDNVKNLASYMRTFSNGVRYANKNGRQN